MAVGVLGTGAYLPSREVTNAELATMVPGADPDWVTAKTMIESRRYAAPHEAASDLAAHAARRALDEAGLDATDVDYVIVATSTGDFPQPPTASVVQRLIGADRAASFDVNVVCAGFVFALATAQGLIAVNPAARALVIGVDVYSRILDFGDRRTAILFGDGAGAAVVGAVPDGYGIVGVDLATRGDAAGLIRVEAGGSRRPASPETLADGGHFFRMDGRGVRAFVADYVPPALAALLDRLDLHAKHIDHFVPHQANGVMLRDLVHAAGLDGAVTHLTLDRYGNVGSASVPITLDAAARAGALGDGDLVLLAGFGGGMSVGAAVLRWHATTSGRPAPA